MAENIIKIGGRFHDTSEGHTVTGANEILDDDLRKKQNVINAEQQEFNQEQEGINADTYRKNEVYNKEETNNIISRTPETDVIVVNVPEGTDIATYLSANIPAAERPNNLFRVPGPDNTTYSEWAWDGTQWIMLANKDYGVDDTPTNASSNFVKSNGIYSEFEEINLPLGKASTAISLSGSIEGKIIDNNGSLIDITTGFVSRPIYLHKGDNVFLKAKNSRFVGAVCSTDENGSSYTVLKLGVGAGDVVPMQSVSYKIAQDGYYAFSWVGAAELNKVSFSVTDKIREDVNHITDIQRRDIPIFESVGGDVTLDNIDEIFIFDKFFRSVTKYVTVSCYQHRLYLVGMKSHDDSQPTWYAKTDVLTGGDNGKVYPVVFTDEAGTPAEAQDGDTIGYVIFSDINTFEGTSVTSGFHPLNLDFISNIRLCPKIATALNNYIVEKTDAEISSINEEIGILNDALGVVKTQIEINIGQSGKCVRETGEVTDIQTSYISSPIYFNAGDIVYFTARGSRYVSMISRTDEEGSVYTPVVIGDGAGDVVPEQTVSYKVENEGYYALCWIWEIGNPSPQCYKIMSLDNNVGAINAKLRNDVPIFESVGDDVTLNNISEVFIYSKYFGSYTNYVTVSCYQHKLYLIGTREYNTSNMTWWACTDVLTGGENGKVYAVRFTDEGGTPAEAQSGDIIGYVVFSDIDTFEGTPVTSNFHPLNLSFISNIRLCPAIANYLNEYIESKYEKIDLISNSLGISTSLRDIPIGITGKCIRETGEVVDIVTSNISTPLYFNAGVKILFTARTSRFVGTICRTDDQASSYTPVAIGVGAGDVVPLQTVEYTTETEGYYAFCWIDNYRNCQIVQDDTVNIQRFNLLAMYDNITYCGDSLTYSQVSTSPSTYRPAKKIYPDIVSSICGNTPTVLAHPGDTAKRWWANFSSQLVEKTNNLYIVYLGTNEGLTDTIDTDCPVSGGVEDYADNNTGCYGKLLKTIQTLGDKAILVKITPEYPHSTVTNNVIEKFGLRFNMPVVKNDRINDIIYRYYPDGSGYDRVHLNDLGYSYFANRLIRDISEMPFEMFRRLAINN